MHRANGPSLGKSEGGYDGWTVAQANPETRISFLHKTYQHLALAIAAFIGLEALLLNIPGLALASLKMFSSGFTWLAILVGFGFASNMAHNWARNATSPQKAYAGLGIYVALQAILFLPLLTVVTYVLKAPDLILQAGWMTAIVVGGLTATILTTKADLSFLGGMLRVGFFVALGVIVVALLFGFNLGLWFSAAMLLLAGGSIAYETSNMVHHYRPGQHVAAALGLFASVALFFWYAIRLAISMRE